MINKCKADMQTMIILIDQKFRPAPIKQIQTALQLIKQQLMNIGDVKIQGEKTVLEIDAVFKMKSKLMIRKHLESMSDYLLDVVNSIASDFVAANATVKKLLKEKKPKLEGGIAIKIKVPKIVSNITKVNDPLKK